MGHAFPRVGIVEVAVLRLVIIAISLRAQCRKIKADLGSIRCLALPAVDIGARHDCACVTETLAPSCHVHTAAVGCRRWGVGRRRNRGISWRRHGRVGRRRNWGVGRRSSMSRSRCRRVGWRRSRWHRSIGRWHWRICRRDRSVRGCGRE